MVVVGRRRICDNVHSAVPFDFGECASEIICLEPIPSDTCSINALTKWLPPSLHIATGGPNDPTHSPNPSAASRAVQPFEGYTFVTRDNPSRITRRYLKTTSSFSTASGNLQKSTWIPSKALLKTHCLPSGLGIWCPFLHLLHCRHPALNVLMSSFLPSHQYCLSSCCMTCTIKTVMSELKFGKRLPASSSTLLSIGVHLCNPSYYFHPVGEIPDRYLGFLGLGKCFFGYELKLPVLNSPQTSKGALLLLLLFSSNDLRRNCNCDNVHLTSYRFSWTLSLITLSDVILLDY